MKADWLALLTEAEGFQWDTGNQTKSLHKHNVTCKEAQSIFKNQPLMIHPDEAHSRNEHRAVALGCTDEGRLLQINFTVRDKYIRIISARPMHHKERSYYEKT